MSRRSSARGARAARTAAALAVVVPFVVGAAAAPTPAPGEVVATFTDPRITESSGLVAPGDGLLVTTNDSGDSGRIFTVDASDGETIGVTSWDGSGPGPTDVEALAPAPEGEVWVGDIGDNDAQRESVEVLRVPVGRGDLEVDPDRFELVYPDGAADAESLLADPGTGRLVVVTKGVFGGRVLQAPVDLDPDRPNELREVGVGLGVATDAAFFPDGRHLVVRNYTEAVVYSWPDLETLGTVALPEQEQGESIAVDPQGRVLVGSEGVDSDVLEVTLPARIRREMAQDVAQAPPGSLPSDTAGPSEEPVPERPLWPFALGSLIGVTALVLLVRSLRPR